VQRQQQQQTIWHADIQLAWHTVDVALIRKDGDMMIVGSQNHGELAFEQGAAHRSLPARR